MQQTPRKKDIENRIRISFSGSVGIHILFAQRSKQNLISIFFIKFKLNMTQSQI